MSYERDVIDLINAAQRKADSRPLILGGVSGPSGGAGGPPGGIIGYLPQNKIAYDESELAIPTTSGNTSLLDNLNHIRYDLDHVIAIGEVPSSGLSLFIDQSGSGGDTYYSLYGSRNGSNTTFLVSEGEYISGNLIVYLNGQLLAQTVDWSETDPSSGTFDLVVPPLSTDVLVVVYGDWTARTDSGTQFYDSVHLAADFLINGSGTPVDIPGMTLTKTLKAGVIYRWKYKYQGHKLTSTGSVTTMITDGAGTILDQNSLAILSGAGIVGISNDLEYIEVGTGATVTRKIMTYVDTDSFQYNLSYNNTFSVEKTG